MQVNATSEKAMTKHQDTETCKKSHKRKLQRKAHRRSALPLDKEFTAYVQKLERVEFFKYQGRLLTYDDNNIQDVRSNLKKARILRAQISDVLQSKNTSPKVCKMFYKATIKSVQVSRR